MRLFILPSRAWAVATKATEPPPALASESARRLLPLLMPPRINSERDACLTQVLPRRPVSGMPAAGQVSWLSDHSTPHAFPARPDPSQWLNRGFRPRLQ